MTIPSKINKQMWLAFFLSLIIGSTLQIIHFSEIGLVISGTGIGIAICMLRWAYFFDKNKAVPL